MTAATLERTEGEWARLANCAGINPDLFFPERGGPIAEAKEVCRSCTVRFECLEYSLEHSEKFGIWGGMTETERRPLRKLRQRAQRAAEMATGTEETSDDDDLD